MPLDLVSQASSWKEAFDKAEEFLAAGQLTAIAFVTKENFRKGHYVALHLAEMGKPEDTLARQRGIIPGLYGQKSLIELHLGRMEYPHAGELVQGWLLVMAYFG